RTHVAVELRRTGDRSFEGNLDARFHHSLGYLVTEIGSKRLPFHSEHSVTLEVAERPVIGDDFESVARALQRPTGSVPPVRTVAHVRMGDGEAVVDAQAAYPSHELLVVE